MAVERMVRVSTKGQIVLPKRIRDEMAIREGDYILVRQMPDGTVALIKPEQSPLWKLTEGLRREAEEQGFTPEDLEELIKSMRRERRSAS